MVQADYDNDGRVDILVLRGAWMKTEGRFPLSLLRNEDSEAATADTGPEDTGEVAPVRFQSTCWAGISSRNRDGGLYDGCPQALRMEARVRYSRSRALVMPT